MSATACAEKAQLLVEYQNATGIYSKAVSELSHDIGTVDKDEYMRLQDFAETCRLHSSEARARLERHIAQHGC